MSSATSTGSAWDRRRWLILGVIGLARLMVVLYVNLISAAGHCTRRARRPRYLTG